MKKNVLLIGGLGFVGHHIVNELLKQNFNVSIGSRSENNDTTAKVPIIKIDLIRMSNEDLTSILAPFNYVIFAGGADDRSILKEDAATFFYHENVKPCVRLAQIAKELPIEKIVILGSYFTYLNRIHPEWKMAAFHPYVRSRILQIEETIAASENKTSIVVLELPYIFGSTQGKIPLWKPLIKYIKKMPLIFYTAGGTNIVAVEEVSKAVVGAIDTKRIENTWLVGGENVSWKSMISMINIALEQKRVIIILPTFIIKFFALLIKFYFKITGKQFGLDLYHFITVQTANTFFETKESMQVLKYGKVDMQDSINATVRASR